MSYYLCTLVSKKLVCPKSGLGSGATRKAACSMVNSQSPTVKVVAEDDTPNLPELHISVTPSGSIRL